MKENKAIDLYVWGGFLVCLVYGVSMGVVVTASLHQVPAPMYNAVMLVSLLSSSWIGWLYRRDRARTWLLRNYLSVIIGEVVVSWCITIAVIQNGDLALRWALYTTIISAFKSILHLFLEAIKEASGRGSIIAAQLSMYESAGQATGLVIAVALGYYDADIISVNAGSIAMATINMVEAMLIINLIRGVGIKP